MIVASAYAYPSRPIVKRHSRTWQSPYRVHVQVVKNNLRTMDTNAQSAVEIGSARSSYPFTALRSTPRITAMGHHHRRWLVTFSRPSLTLRRTSSKLERGTEQRSNDHAGDTNTSPVQKSYKGAVLAEICVLTLGPYSLLQLLLILCSGGTELP